MPGQDSVQKMVEHFQKQCHGPVARSCLDLDEMIGLLQSYLYQNKSVYPYSMRRCTDGVITRKAAVGLTVSVAREHGPEKDDSAIISDRGINSPSKEAP